MLQFFGICRAEHFEHPVISDVACAIAHAHIGNGQSVSDAAFACLRNQIHRFALVLDGDVVKYVTDTLCYDLAWHEPEIETQTTRQNRGGNLVYLGCGKDENRVRRRLFERLQKSIERSLGKHVHFVDDVDLVSADRGWKVDLVRQFPDLIHRVVGRSVYLENVKI